MTFLPGQRVASASQRDVDLGARRAALRSLHSYEAEQDRLQALEDEREALEEMDDAA